MDGAERDACSGIDTLNALAEQRIDDRLSLKHALTFAEVLAVGECTQTKSCRGLWERQVLIQRPSLCMA